MSRRPLRPLASFAALAWILAQGHPVATALHVAEDHAHHGHGHRAVPSAEAPAYTGHGHAHPDDGHVHGLPDALPGVRGDSRIAPAAPAPGLDGAPVPADGRVARGRPASRAPDPPPPQAPAVLLL